MRTRLGLLLGVIVLAGGGWLSEASAAVAANTTLNIDITVTVPATVRIEWAATVAAMGAGVTDGGVGLATWALGNQDLAATVTDNNLKIRNKGNVRVAIAAAVSADTAAAPWVVAAPPLTGTTDTVAIKLNALQFVGTASQQLTASLKKTDADTSIALEFMTPIDATTASLGIQHKFTITMTASAA
ncbi:MAG TPA: hypothetical protein VGP72_19650 [Planctomycetota bacterium]|jgi:hypothetical protein